jgi:hypothetical protein
MRKFAVVTTFNKAGMESYGQRMIDSFAENWPKEVTLHVYAENCNPILKSENIIIKNIQEVKDLNKFKERWKDIPKANGVCPWPERRPRDYHKKFKWDAVRFSHKVYSIFDCAKSVDADVLIWMDGDTFCHSPITLEKISQLIPETVDIGYLGRGRKWPECGLYSMALRRKGTQKFLKAFKQAYDDAEAGIFTMAEWHDSFVFEEIRKSSNPSTINWSAGIVNGEGHPLINTEWGAFLDHLKGERKTVGVSRKKDLVVERTEDYWRNI